MFTIDGCQPAGTATVSVDGGPAQDFVVPASGVVSGYIVLPAGAPEPTTLTNTCDGYTTTVPITDRSAELIIEAIDDADILGGAPSGSGTAPADPALPAVPVAVPPSYDAIVAAAMTEGAASITLADPELRTFTIDGLEIANPATTGAEVTGSGIDGEEYRVAPAPLAEVASAAAAVAEGSDAALSVLRMVLVGLAAAGLVLFAWRRRSRDVAVTTA